LCQLIPAISSGKGRKTLSMPVVSERIQEIRLRVRAERTAISGLQTKTEDDVLKQRLEQASNMLNDVEKLLLNAANLAEPGSPSAPNQWLDGTEGVLQGAEKIRQYVEASLTSLHLPFARPRIRLALSRRGQRP
jgi:hypothetical protein